MPRTCARAAVAVLLWGLAPISVPTVADEPTTQPAKYKDQAGPFTVAVQSFDWRDETRDRVVPVKIYYPKTGDGPFPVILFSHGLGGSRDGYEYVGRHWASHGYVCVHLQHAGTDTGVWKGQKKPLDAMRAAASKPLNAVDRGQDVRFALDQVEKLSRETPPFKGRLDLEHIGIAGHSFGAHTTLVAAGLAFVGRRGPEAPLADPRIKAALPMSPPVPVKRDDLDAVYSRIRIPCLHMTGTRDDSVIADTKAADRRLPFDRIRASDQYLLILKDGDHGVFTGRERPGRRSQDARFHELIRMSSTAFWDAYLRGDAKARAWLADGGFAAALGADGTFEHK